MSGREQTVPASVLDTPYDASFFQTIAAGSSQSAMRVLPYVIHLLNPKSIVDIGCGTGEWLKVAQSLGVHDILGIDGKYVDRQQLKIDAHAFMSWDLTQPLNLSRKFDLAICLEVLEHLPDKVGRRIISEITRVTNACLFSAALPNQGGVHHINEQWHEHWHEIFTAKGWLVCDILRMRFLFDPLIEWWYRQNLFLYVSPRTWDVNAHLRQVVAEVSAVGPWEIYHPRITAHFKYLHGLCRLLGNSLIRKLRNWG